MEFEVEKSLLRHLGVIVDPRIDRTKKHNLLDILVTAVCGVLSGCDNWVEIVDWAEENLDWLGGFLKLPHGIPSHDTFARVFAILDAEQFQLAFSEWVNGIKEGLPEREIINIDGKFLRGSKWEYNSRNAILIVSAWASKAGISLGQLSSRLSKDEGEKKTAEKLLDAIKVEGNIITLDAMGATPKIVQKIVTKKGDYVVAIKDNQRAVKRLGIKLFDSNSDKLKSLTTEENGHGRYEKREYHLLILAEAQTSGMNQAIGKYLGKFANPFSIGTVKSTRTENGKTSLETRHYLTSLREISEFSESVREHWAIENCLHWHMDVTFREDGSRARIGHSAENFATVRRLALNMLKQETTEKRGLQRKRRLCGWRKEYLLQVVLGYRAN